MNSGKKQSLPKTREPYGKVTEVGQVPVALQEIEELAQIGLKTKNVAEQSDCFKRIQNMAQSALSVTCANPGCLSQMAEAATLIPIEQAFTCHGCNEGAPPQRGKRRPPAPGSEAVRRDLATPAEWRRARACLLPSAVPTAPCSLRRRRESIGDDAT